MGTVLAIWQLSQMDNLKSKPHAYQSASNTATGHTQSSLTQAVLPLDHIGDEQYGEPQQGSGNGIDANRASKDPEAHSDGKGAGSDLLVQGEGPQLLQLLPGLLGSIRRVLHLCTQCSQPY